DRYCHLRLTRERFPRLSLVRQVLPDGARYLGPFPSAGQAELVKAAIEDALPLGRCTMRLGARGGGSACALLELGRCLGPCTGAVAEERYAALVATLESALDGDPEPVLGPLRRRMAGYAADQRYEQAAGARDRLEGLTRARAAARPPPAPWPGPAAPPPSPPPTRSSSPAPTPRAERSRSSAAASSPPSPCSPPPTIQRPRTRRWTATLDCGGCWPGRRRRRGSRGRRPGLWPAGATLATARW